MSNTEHINKSDSDFVEKPNNEQANALRGTIFNIQRFSIYDGPGIRTTVFFKGCNLNCVWCHNPESIAMKKEIEIYPERCTGCGKCYGLCPRKAHYNDENGVHHINRDLCDGCLICSDNCFAEALVAVGEDISTDALLKSIITDKPYYEESGGGVTFSGGECTAQITFLEEILRKCQAAGIHTAVDTAGNVPWAHFEKILPYTDLFLYDVKTADSKVHKNVTGQGNELILDNLRKLSRLGKRIFVRIPYIPGKNTEEMDGIADILNEIACEKVELMPFHRLGEGKYTALDLPIPEVPILIPTDDTLEAVIDRFKGKGITVRRA